MGPDLLLLVVVGTTIWLGVDASQRDFSNSGVARSTAGWVIGSLLLWIVVFPLYLVKRGGAPKEGQRAPAQASPAWSSASQSIAPPAQWLPPSAAPTKRCPDCAEDIRREARKCRFCGWTDRG